MIVMNAQGGKNMAYRELVRIPTNVLINNYVLLLLLRMLCCHLIAEYSFAECKTT
jgi:hypothetical protein